MGPRLDVIFVFGGAGVVINSLKITLQIRI